MQPCYLYPGVVKILFMQNGEDQEYWDKIGKSYTTFWKSKAKQEINKKELAFINKYLRKTQGQSILDIGVGSGRIIENYLSNSTVQGIYGIDWAKSMVKFCRNKFKADKRVKRLVVCNISKEKFPFKGNFDFISAIRVLKYNKNWRGIVRKIINKLGKQDIFVFTIPNRNAFLRFTNSETAIYNATKDEIESFIKTQKGKILQITTLAKLPDVIYDISDNRFYVQAILLLEGLLRKLFGDIFLGREFFVAVSNK